MTSTSKKLYVAPRLEEHGSVADTTLGAWIEYYEGGSPPHLM